MPLLVLRRPDSAASVPTGREETGAVEGLRRIEAARGFLSGVLQDLTVVEPTLLISESHRGGALFAPKRAQAFAGVGEPHEDAEEGEGDEQKFLAQEATEEKARRVRIIAELPV